MKKEDEFRFIPLEEEALREWVEGLFNEYILIKNPKPTDWENAWWGLYKKKKRRINRAGLSFEGFFDKANIIYQKIKSSKKPQATFPKDVLRVGHAFKNECILLNRDPETGDPIRDSEE